MREFTSLRTFLNQDFEEFPLLVRPMTSEVMDTQDKNGRRVVFILIGHWSVSFCHISTQNDYTHMVCI